MTRETKIGLLVGLAFVLVVGILLSEHLTSATERPAAELAAAGRSVRQGVSAPGSAPEEAAGAAAPEAPHQMVPIARDLTAANTPPAPTPQVTIITPAPAPVAPPTQTILVQAPQPAPMPPAVASSNNSAAPTGPQLPPVVTKAPPVAVPVDPFANDPVARIAQLHGEPLVPVDTKSSEITPPTPVIGGGPVATVAATQSYKAQAGDTLAKIAGHLAGGSTKAGRDAIVALNPTLQKDPNKIIAGRTYLLPADLKATAPAIATAEKASPAPKPVIATNDPKTGHSNGPAGGEAGASPRVYVVKAGDTLTKIAVAELGSKTHVDDIKKLNADSLKGGDKITVNMKLRLPEKA